MGLVNVWAPLLRIPAIVILLVAAGRNSETMTEGITRLQIGSVWRAWIPLAVLGAAVAAVIVAGRDREHHPAILVLEAVIASVLGFVPAAQWLMWFGVTGIFGFTFAYAGADGFIQALAIVWFVTAIATAARQRRPRDDGKHPVDSSAASQA